MAKCVSGLSMQPAKLLFISSNLIFASLILACSGRDPSPKIGCSIGYRKSDPPIEKVLLRCATKEEHNAGDNIRSGGVRYFNNYTDHQWVPVSDCSECDKYRK